MGGTISDRLAASLTLFLAGAFTLLASFERWWPVCRPGLIDSAACQELLNFRHDELVATMVWDPTFATNAYRVAAAVLTAIGLVLVGRIALPPGRSQLPLVSGGAVLVIHALVTWWGYSIPWISPLGIALMALVAWGLFGPVVLFYTWRISVDEGRSAGWSDALMFLALVLATPLIALVAGALTVGSWSYLDVPWHDGFGAAALIVAGLAAGLGLTRSRDSGIDYQRQEETPNGSLTEGVGRADS